MEEDKRLQAAGALAAIVAFVLVVVQFSGGRAAPKASSGPGWYARINPFGSAPSADPSPAYERPAPELAPPERVMTNAASRQFSSPTSAGSSGGLAGAEPVSAPAAAATPMTAPRLAGGGYVDLPGGGNAPTAGGAASFARPPGGRTNAPPPGRGAAAPPAPAGGPRASGGGASPGGDTQSAAAAASSFGRAAGAGVAGGSIPGTPRLGAMDANGVASRAPGLNDTPKLSGSSSGGGAGPGDLGGGGGAGKGGSGGMGGAVPGGKPKESAGKPDGVDAGAGGAAAGTGTAGGPGGGLGEGSVAEVRTPNSQIGAPQVVSTSAIPGALFRSHPNGEKDVPTTIYVTPRTRLIGYTAKLAIDADGAGGAWRGDRTGQPKTSLLYKNGDSLNPSELPFIVVPPDFRSTYKGVELGDYAAVTYRQKTVYAIIGDHGPAGVLGEGSISLAAGLGIDSDPNKGGTNRKEVRYLIAPGSKDPDGPPRDAAAIQTRGTSIFNAAGAPVR